MKQKHSNIRLLISMITMVVSIGNFSEGKTGLSPAETFLKSADDIRNPGESFEMNIDVEDSDNSSSSFAVFLKGKDKTMIVTKAPSRDRGRNMLMLERDFKVYVPNLKRSMRLSLAQKLSGQVANGDIARTRWFGDYEATIEATEAKNVRLYLRARSDNLTYPAIRLWIDKISKRPIHAEYLGSNGKTVLKNAYFEDYKLMEGLMRPALIRIEDTSGKTSRIIIKSMKKTKLEDSFFTVRNSETIR